MHNIQKLKVFTDFHHASLLNSLILLFEKRLGGEVYRPIGKDWYESGYWKVYDHPATAEQFLGINGATPDGTEPVNTVEAISGRKDPRTGKVITDIYHCHDIETGDTNKAINLDGFFARHFDVVIASLPQHIEPFRKLCNAHKSKPVLIYQIGNSWNIEPHLAHNLNGVMASASIVKDYPLPTVQYHQEFDLNMFRYEQPLQGKLPISGNPTQWPEKVINSYVNCFSEASIFQMDWTIFRLVEEKMTDWLFRSYGGQCRDGACHGIEELSESMRNSRFIWHTKYGGDGYGHILHNAAACGRPLIVRKEYYLGKLAEPLLIDGETCICIDGLGVGEIIEKIEHYNAPDTYLELCQKMRKKFNEVVDFSKEFTHICEFLHKV